MYMIQNQKLSNVITTKHRVKHYYSWYIITRTENKFIGFGFELIDALKYKME